MAPIDTIPVIQEPRGREFEVEIQLRGEVGAVRQHLLYNDIPAVQGVRHKLTDWLVKSYRPSGAESNLIAIMSPILSGTTGLAQVRKVMDLFTTNPIPRQPASRRITQPSVHQVQLNKQCSLRVHVDTRHFTIDNYKDLMNFYKSNETAIDRLMPPSRRNDPAVCRSLIQNVRDLSSYVTISQLAGAFSSVVSYKLSFVDINSFGTVSFNHHSGTLNSNKALNWIKFCLCMVEQTGTPRRNLWDGVPEDIENYYTQRSEQIQSVRRPRN